MFKAIDRFVDKLLLRIYDASECIDSFFKKLGEYGKT